MPLKKAPIMRPKVPTNSPNLTAGSQQAMPVMGHLLELRKRLLYCLALFVGGSGLAYVYAAQILQLLAYPLLSQAQAPQRFIYTGLTEAFITFIKVSCFTGGVVTLPFVLYQVWRFIAPALYHQERCFVRSFFWMSPLLFVGGLLFAYFFILPPAWAFFLAFQNQGPLGGVPLALEARIAEYISLSIQVLLAFSICFQLPVILVLLGETGIITSGLLRRGRRYAFLLILIISAILTPPDVLSMIGLALPLYALYEMSIISLKGRERRHKKKETNVRY